MHVEVMGVINVDIILQAIFRKIKFLSVLSFV